MENAAVHVLLAHRKEQRVKFNNSIFIFHIWFVKPSIASTNEALLLQYKH